MILRLFYLLNYIHIVDVCFRFRPGEGSGVPRTVVDYDDIFPPVTCPFVSTNFSRVTGFGDISSGTFDPPMGENIRYSCPAGTMLLLQSFGETTTSTATLSCNNLVWTLSDGTPFDSATVTVSCGNRCCVSNVTSGLPMWYSNATILFTDPTQTCSGSAFCRAPAQFVGIQNDGTEVDGIISPSCQNGQFVDAAGGEYNNVFCRNCNNCTGADINSDVEGCKAFTGLDCIPLNASLAGDTIIMGSTTSLNGCTMPVGACFPPKMFTTTTLYYSLDNGQQIRLDDLPSSAIITCQNSQPFIQFEGPDGLVSGFIKGGACAGVQM